jgi:hypothetical protein
MIDNKFLHIYARPTNIFVEGLTGHMQILNNYNKKTCCPE